MKRIVIALACAVVAAIPAAAPAASAPQKNLVETAVSAPQFSTLVSLVRKAGLVRTLSGRTAYTVFAPTNAAFDRVPRRTLAALARDRAMLKAVLLYHVVRCRVPARAVVRLDSARTVNGARVAIRLRRGKVYVNDAQVTKADIAASNGVVHQINRVLLPPM